MQIVEFLAFFLTKVMLLNDSLYTRYYTIAGGD